LAERSGTLGAYFKTAVLPTRALATVRPAARAAATRPVPCNRAVVAATVACCLAYNRMGFLAETPFPTVSVGDRFLTAVACREGAQGCADERCTGYPVSRSGCLSGSRRVERREVYEVTYRCCMRSYIDEDA